MTLNTFLFNARWITFIASNVTVLYFLYPAYKRTKSLAIALLFYGYLLGTFLEITSRTIGKTHMTHVEWIGYWTLWDLTYIATCIIGATGFIVLLRDYLKLHASGAHDTSDTTESLIPKPVKYLFKVFRRMFE